MKVEDLYEKAELLMEYADLEGSELGDFNLKLCDLVGGLLDYSSEGFQEAVEKEVSSQLLWFQENTKIITSEREIITVPFSELEYLND